MPDGSGRFVATVSNDPFPTSQGDLLVKDRFWNQVLPAQTQTCNGRHAPHSRQQARTSNVALATPAELVGVDPPAQMAGVAIRATGDVLEDARQLVAALQADGRSTRRLGKRLTRAERLRRRSERSLEHGRPKRAVRLAELAGRRGLSLRRSALRRQNRLE